PIAGSRPGFEKRTTTRDVNRGQFPRWVQGCPRAWRQSDMTQTETYNDHVVRLFLLAATVWGIVGMTIGVFAAAQLAWPALNLDIPWLTFSRLRPNHTFGVVF